MADDIVQSFDKVQIKDAVTALDRACSQVRTILPDFTHRCQNHSSINGFFPPCENDQWTTGFWPGQIWLAYEFTGHSAFRDSALVLVDSFRHRIENRIAVDHHDMGFLYTPSCTAAWKLAGSAIGRDAAILAARQLEGRFHEKGEFIQAWGSMGARGNYRFIIDCLMNLPLLYWATETTGEEHFRDIALRHTKTCIENSIRRDGSTWHTFFMDPETGLPDHGETCQGFRDDSSWARGQAWAIYGLALSYRYTQEPAYLPLFRNVLDYFLSRLPADLVPYWDLIFSDGDDEPRDSSSAAIAVCGLLEMEKYVGGTEAEYYGTAARRILKSLIDGYSVKDQTLSNGRLLHGTYSKKSPYNTCTEEGVDECLAWGDYFYMEALMRVTTDWVPYW